MMYASLDLLTTAGTEVAGRESDPPFFAAPIFLDDDLARSFLGFHQASEGKVPRLEQESRLFSVLTQFVLRHADTRFSPRPAGKERQAVKLVREHLEDNHAENVSLEELARLANLSPFHLVRVFREEVGLPPHAYQVGVRLARAKGLLLRGWPIAQVAQGTGFADQSHFTRRFKRLVGVPPGSYAKTARTFNTRTTE